MKASIFISPAALTAISISDPISQFSYYCLQLVQSTVVYLFSPKPPVADCKLAGPRIAIVGAGLSGVSAAAHCVGHGSDVVIYEARSRENLGGIWSRVNSTSTLQLYSIMYRFHPSVHWYRGYPSRGRILEEVELLWHRYGLESKTRFNTPVFSVERDDHGRYVINGEDAPFDGVIVTVGTCGDPMTPYLPGQKRCAGKIVHSSQLDGLDVRGKKVVVIGGGASAVETVEYAVAKGARSIDILARSDKWIIPRNFLVDSLLGLNVTGYQNALCFIAEYFLRRLFYRDLADLAPADKGLFTGTPMCNDQILAEIRAGRARWLRGDILDFDRDGIHFNERQPGVPVGGSGKKVSIPGDVYVCATGFARPSLDFLPRDVFAPPYEPPAWYLQTFPPAYPEICAINSTFIDAVGTVGHAHIGWYTRSLLMFLIDSRTKPSPEEMKRWIDNTRWLKRKAPTKAFEFVTYSEMTLWILECIARSPRRWPWAAFVLCGWGVAGRAEKHAAFKQATQSS